ncbi:MAG: 6-pyruvoyl-tetrahydropterin synthase-related protein [Firmicutes bacterium]|nr:6-pyruvoyl-tetrahydropterin synthase-related protein [Bacillota bacterium]
MKIRASKGPELRLSITLFVSVLHRVNVSGGPGDLHKHSCSVEVELTPSPGDIIPFARLESTMRAMVSPFDGKLLNDVPDFKDTEPTIENLCHLLHRRLEAAMLEHGAVVNSVTLRESPTRSVRVVSPAPAVPEAADQPAEEGRPDRRGPPAEPLLLPPRGAVEVPGTRAPTPVETRSVREPPPVEEEKTAAASVEAPPSLPARTIRKAWRLRRMEAQPAGRWFLTPAPSAGAIPVWRSLLLYSAGFLVLALVAAAAYRELLLPQPSAGYPWGSDTWGHIAKAEFLLAEIRRGNLYPRFNPAWYNGVEPFRYWAPGPYYALAAMATLCGDSFTAAGWFVAICALVGGTGWLLHRRRLGFPVALALGTLWTVWPDHVRVAMSEGNLPRATATALFPWVLNWFLAVMEEERPCASIAGCACVASLLVLTHAMIAASFFAELFILSLFWIIQGRKRVRSMVLGVASLLGGIGLSAWWLLPALQGGIASISAAAVSATIDYFPLSRSFDPSIRLVNPESFYWGVSLLPLALWVIVTWPRRQDLGKASLATGAVLVAITTPALRPVYSAIPFHHLLWPLYMVSGAVGIFFLAGFLPIRTYSRGERKYVIATMLALFLFSLADAYPSLRLIATRPLPVFLEAAERRIPDDGWRVATLDLSGFGSAGTYLFGRGSEREQVYGWAWQGAATAREIVGLNTALRDEFPAFLFDRLKEMGATSLVVRRPLIEPYVDAFLWEAGAQGYREVWRSQDVLILARKTGPYAVRTSYAALGIGSFVPNLSLIFPSIQAGESDVIDSYSPDRLRQYPCVILSGATWTDKAAAEWVLSQYVLSGGRLVIDMQGLPEDVLSKRPSILGVTGEPVLIYNPIEVVGGDSQVVRLRDFDPSHYPWKALSPQGLDNSVLTYEHLGEKAVLTGTRTIHGRDVWFVGANLPFHAFLTRDSAAVGVLSSVLDIKPHAPPERAEIPLDGYEADAAGYRFSLTVPESWGSSSITVPVATRENLVVRVDGREARWGSVHHLLQLNLGPGAHSVEIEIAAPAAERTGAMVSAAALVLVAIVMLVQKRGGARDKKTGGGRDLGDAS